MRKMLTPHVRAIGRPAGPAQDDAVDPAGVEGTPAALKNDLIQLVGSTILSAIVIIVALLVNPVKALILVGYFVLYQMPPISLFASNTSTSNPALSMECKTARPAPPAPITTTFISYTLGFVYRGKLDTI